MSSLPSELWSEVLRHIYDVRDFGKLEQVSRVFRWKVLSEGWPRIRRLCLRVVLNRHSTILEVDGVRIVANNPDKILKMIGSIVRKATKLQDLECKADWERYFEEWKTCLVDDVDPYEFIPSQKHLLPQLLQPLAASNSKTIQFYGDWGDQEATKAVGSLIQNLSSSLTHLSLFCVLRAEGLPAVFAAVGNCTNLELLNLRKPKFRPESISGFIIRGNLGPEANNQLSQLLGVKPNLVHLDLSGLGSSLLDLQTAVEGILNMQAHLEIMHFHQLHMTAFLDQYSARVRDVPVHPLQSLRDLETALPENPEILLDVCPNLKRIFVPEFGGQLLTLPCRLMSAFFLRFGSNELEMWDECCCVNVAGLREVVEESVDVDSVEVLGIIHGSWIAVAFRKRNALVKIMIRPVR